jgi:hypothetical protein
VRPRNSRGRFPTIPTISNKSTKRLANPHIHIMEIKKDEKENN